DVVIAARRPRRRWGRHRRYGLVKRGYRAAQQRAGNCSLRSAARAELGVLVDRQVLADFREVRNGGDVRGVRAGALLRPVERIVRNEGSPKLLHVGIEREFLDDMQLITVRRSTVEQAR